jgi:hypothetical protein
LGPAGFVPGLSVSALHVPCGPLNPTRPSAWPARPSRLPRARAGRRQRARAVPVARHCRSGQGRGGSSAWARLAGSSHRTGGSLHAAAHGSITEQARSLAAQWQGAVMCKGPLTCCPGAVHATLGACAASGRRQWWAPTSTPTPPREVKPRRPTPPRQPAHLLSAGMSTIWTSGPSSTSSTSKLSDSPCARSPAAKGTPPPGP